MKNIITLISIVFFFGISLNIPGQTVLFSEDFESGEIPLNWNEQFIKGSINWRYEPGGYSLNPEIPNTRKPLAAHGGSFNALFQFQSPASEATRLVTKKISALEFAIKPELHFFNAQLDWKHGQDYYNDYLRVYFKSSTNAPWTLLREYTEATTGWVERIILLPEDDLSADCYLAFEGETKWGWGTCVDDIQIIETGILQKYLSEIDVEQASVVSVASGTTNNPVLKIKIKVMGNSGTLPLNSLIVQSNNTSDSDIEPGGVKIYHTTDAEFNPNEQVGAGISFDNGLAVFSDLNYDLPTGYSYLWITYDVKSMAGHRNSIDAKFNANAININGNNYFNAAKSPVGARTVLQTIYMDDFESSLNWSLTGEFEYGSPQGLGGSQGNPDPINAFNGNYVIGTDLTGLGEYGGDYEKNLYTDDYTAISDTIDLTYYNDLSIRYMRYLNIGINDEAFVRVSPDAGKTWLTAWRNTSMILDDIWKLHEIDITPFVARKDKVLVMYSLGTTNDYWQLSGWNIDDFSVTGNFVSKDVGISRIISPYPGCDHSSPDSVSVMVKNFGATDSYGIIPLQYSADGKKTLVRDTLYQAIAFGDSAVFTFKKTVNLSVPDIYNFYVSTDMPDDDDMSNNAIEKFLYIQPTFVADHSENFENDGGLWMPKNKTNQSWEWGTPGYGIIPPSGTKVWMTRLTSNYSDNDSSFIESACYSNPESKRKILGLKYWAEAESHKDGAALQYSSDNGATWQLVDTLINRWNWYTDTIQALNSRGWSGYSGGWKNATIVLPKYITDEPQVKFRLHFASDEINNNIGLAFDDFTVSVAPHDIGVAAIENFADACQGINPDHITVTIKNFGINTLRQNDTVIVGFDLNNETAAIDTFMLDSDLSPGETVQYTFIDPVNVNEPGEYFFTAYSLIERDPWFYGLNNDTAFLGITIFPNPVTSLADTIQTHLPDTIVLETFFDADYDYWWNGIAGSNIYNVPDDGWQYLTVTATRGNGCTSYDSTNVELLFYDVGTAELIHPVNNCGFGKYEYPVVRVQNFGTDSIVSGQKIAVTFTLNGGMPVTDTLELSGTLYSGRTNDFTFSRSPLDLSAQGTYNFKVYTSYGGDTISVNDTIFRSIEILGRPEVNLGPDVTVEALTYTLDPGSSYESYLWDNGVTTQTREVSESGSFWVRVQDANLCDNYDTVNIRLKIRDISPGGIESPLSGCSFDPKVAVSFRILNTGTDTVPSGSRIAVGYKFEENERISDTITIGQSIIPGAYVIHTFNDSVDLSISGDYELHIATVIEGDLRTGNDTSFTVVYRYEKPVVDFGLNDTEFIEDVSFDLDAGYSPYYSYQWHDTTTGHLYTATSSGLCYVTATDNRTLCFDSDSVNIVLIYGDIGITWTDMPENGCSGSFENVRIRVSNLGPSVIGSSAPVYVACDVNGNRVTVDTLTRSGNFNPGASMEMNLTENITVINMGISRVAIYSLYGDDKKPENDTLVINFDALPAPVIDFGDVNGNLTVDLPHLLDAGTGHRSYLWQDNSTDQTYNVTVKGEYRVTVTGMNDCQTTKTVYINMQSGMKEYNSQELVVYPNPGNGVFRFRMDEQKDDMTLRIMNSQGQLVYIRKFAPGQLNNEAIDVQDLPRGIYYLSLESEEQLLRGKIVIE